MHLSVVRVTPDESTLKVFEMLEEAVEVKSWFGATTFPILPVYAPVEILRAAVDQNSPTSSFLKVYEHSVMRLSPT